MGASFPGELGERLVLVPGAELQGTPTHLTRGCGFYYVCIM